MLSKLRCQTLSCTTTSRCMPSRHDNTAEDTQNLHRLWSASPSEEVLMDPHPWNFHRPLDAQRRITHQFLFSLYMRCFLCRARHGGSQLRPWLQLTQETHLQRPAIPLQKVVGQCCPMPAVNVSYQSLKVCCSHLMLPFHVFCHIRAQSWRWCISKHDETRAL